MVSGVTGAPEKGPGGYESQAAPRTAGSGDHGHCVSRSDASLCDGKVVPGPSGHVFRRALGAEPAPLGHVAIIERLLCAGGPGGVSVSPCFPTSAQRGCFLADGN